MTAPQQKTTDVLIDFISAFFVPMFLADCNGDIALAQLAAIHTMNAYRIRHQADMLTVAQIVAFGFATLSSLSLSMADDISLSMILRLRGNANACNRSAEQNRRVLQASHQAPQFANTASAVAAAPDVPTPQPYPPAAVHASAPQQPIPQQPAPPTPDQQRRTAWAAAFTQVAEECTAELPHLPPEEQKLASIRAAALNGSASALLAGIGQPASRSHCQGPALKPRGV